MEVNMKYTLKVKRPCDSDYSTFIDTRDLKLIVRGMKVANQYGWKFKLKKVGDDLGTC